MVKGKLTTVLIVIILACVAYMTMWFFYANIISEYSGILNFTIDESFNKTYLKMNETFGDIHDDTVATQQKYLNTTKGTGSTAYESAILGGWGVIRFIFRSVDLASTLISDTYTKLNVPSYWMFAFVAIISIVIVIAVIAGILRAPGW